jgi:hypothetical protein
MISPTTRTPDRGKFSMISTALFLLKIRRIEVPRHFPGEKAIFDGLLCYAGGPFLSILFSAAAMAQARFPVDFTGIIK